jgi:hypothetical protein
MPDDAVARGVAGSWESDQRLIAFARARLRELELDGPGDDGQATSIVRANQRIVEEFVDRRRAAGRNDLHGHEQLGGTDVWGLRIAVAYLAELWEHHADFHDEWRP